MFMTNQQSAELSEPGVGALHNPAAEISSQFPPIFVAPLPVVLPIRHNQVDAAFVQPPTQRVAECSIWRIAGIHASKFFDSRSPHFFKEEHRRAPVREG